MITTFIGLNVPSRLKGIKTQRSQSPYRRNGRLV